ncbi:Ubiquitin-conjugating enzyme [Mycena indigotica]|uniref:Ubiquitin-conjugating enzyme n=1 Tax=Mycena indigotica TaxID=2126181 RepID=A0A8H6S9J4_9AGAR|nr:Ubiquitin-conjugating enzyme [Mycena indigotica]KAF7295476.1 Ubiquitin-conjugating enzyme [Mycena indigotica]
MAARLSRQFVSKTARISRSLRSNGSRRLMSADAGAHHEYKPGSDLPWILGAAVITVPTLGYILKDTFAIKERIAAGDHGHGHGHDDSHSHSEKHEEKHAEPVVMKDDEGKEADVTSSVKAAEAEDAPKSAGASTEESSDAAAAEPPKDEKEKDGEKEESK